MDVKTILKLFATAAILVVIDRVEFLYYAYDGNGVTVSFWCCHEPIAQSWWVQIESYYLQLFLFSLIGLMWLPLKKHFWPICLTFFLCMVEFAFTYGEPIAKSPLPIFGWYVPASVSTLRFLAVMYYFTMVVREFLKLMKANGK